MGDLREYGFTKAHIIMSFKKSEHYTVVQQANDFRLAFAKSGNMAVCAAGVEAYGPTPQKSVKNTQNDGENAPKRNVHPFITGLRAKLPGPFAFRCARPRPNGLLSNPIENSRSHRSTEAYIEVPPRIARIPWRNTAVARLRLSLMCYSQCFS
jgi:hypothetical protein